ncbi:MAG: hypothetical protein OQK53_08940, partial [Rhodospirillales bacterium]|nr:hypothetical protein [Rhodospirillales bacterium]
MIDGGIYLGRDPTREIGLDDDALIARLDAYGAGRALALSNRAIFYDSRSGNAETLAACTRSGGRFLPVASLNLGGYDCTAGTMAALKAQEFLAVALFPQHQAWTWADASARAALFEAADAGLPVQAGVMSTAELGILARTAEGTGATVMVRWLRGGGYNAVPDYLAIGAGNPHFLFDVGTVSQAGG